MRVQRFVLVGMVAVSLFAADFVSAEAIVQSGLSLFSTGPGTSLFGVPMVGSALGTYDFGGSVGVRNVGNTDTIIRRDASASPSSNSGQVISEILQMRLVTASPTDFGAGTGLYFFTLQSDRGSAFNFPAGGTTFAFDNFGGGTYSESFTVAYDLRFGSPTGPIVRSDSVTIGHSGTPWTHTAPGDALLIDGINHLLNGTDTSGDLWPGTLQWPTSQDPAAATLGLSQSTADIAAAPLPATAWAGLVLLGGLGAYKLARRKAQARVA